LPISNAIGTHRIERRDRAGKPLPAPVPALADRLITRTEAEHAGTVAGFVN
jgi:hypothetical protein